MEERLLEPLGMSQTGYDLEGGGAEWMARGHRRLAATSFNTGGEARRGAGGLRSNVLDMLEYLKANVGPAANSLEELLREAHEPRVAIGDRGSRVGLAWVTTVAGERSVVEHRGGTGGFTSRIAFDPDRGVGYVLLTNSRSYSDPTVNGLLALGPPLDFLESPLSADVLSRIAGAYRTDRGGRLYLRHEPEGYLTAQFSEYVRARLYSRSDTSFFMKHAPMTLTPVRADDGSVTGMVIERVGGEPGSAERIGDSIPDPQTVRAGAVWSSLELEWADARRFVGIGALSVAVLAVLVLGVAWRRRVGAR